MRYPSAPPMMAIKPNHFLVEYCVLLTFTVVHTSANGTLPIIHRPTNVSNQPDPRSAGRVPPYQPPAIGVQGIQSKPAFRPHNPFTRVEPWRPGHILLNPKGSYVIADDVADGSDDDGCHLNCPENSFFCVDPCMCIPPEQYCDGTVDCANGEDETGCPPSCTEKENRTFCEGGSVCISHDWICDGDDDCGDFWDEANCGSHNCTSEEFRCNNGLCINLAWRCDGENDCQDHSDELNCTMRPFTDHQKKQCRDNEFTCASGDCLAIQWRCDREFDCPDKSDEENCPLDILQCGENEIQCNNNNCVRKDFRCDGDDDCGDWTDEDTCPVETQTCGTGEFKCKDGRCIPGVFVCDGARDCLEGEDEVDCEPYQMRNCTEDEFTCLDRRCIKKTWICDGQKDCTNGEDELQECHLSCEQGQYMCKLVTSKVFKQCVTQKHVCDGMNDCHFGDDELNCPTKRPCGPKDRCEKECITTHDGTPGCSCPLGYILENDGVSCRDIDECMYAQDPVCSQTCSNTPGSFTCGCMTGYVLRPDKRTCKASGESPSILLSNQLGIREIWLSGKNMVPILKGLHVAIALDYHYEKQLLFWSESNTKAIRVYSFITNKITDVVRWGLEKPAGLAVDWIHDLLFWTDCGTRRVEVANLNGTRRVVLASSDIDKPRAIAVHPGDGLVFWTDWGPDPKIERADMDGSHRKTVIGSGVFWPNGLTIDYTESKIYWADAKHHVIERASFDGGYRKTVRVSTKDLPHPFALTVFEDAIYWTDWHTRSVFTVNKNTGMGMQVIHSTRQIPIDLKTYHPLRQPQTYKNRCGTNNGGCTHLCLPNSKGHSCRCNIAFNLMADGRTCGKTPEKLLIYARKKDIWLKQLNPRKLMDALDMVIPVHNIKSAIALDWDYKTNSIFWTDVEKNTINKAYLNGSEQRVVIGSNLVSPAGLAYDWLTDKLYWTDSGTNRIEVANTDGSMRYMLAWEDIDKPRDIVVDPKGGRMYWSDWGVEPCIEVADMDGGNRRRLISNGMWWPNGLALDFDKNRIYWTDGGNRTIEYANMDGSGRTVLIDSHLPHPFGLDVFGDEVFWTDWDSKSLQAANKNTGKNRRTISVGIDDLMDVRVFHKERRGVNSISNRCGMNNGGCSDLCLLKPEGRTCACSIGIKLSKDGRTCINGPVNYLIFAHRIDLRIVSLDVPYLVDVVLPLPPLKNALGVDVDLKTGLIYWTDTGERKIKRANKNGKDIETIIDKGLHTADGIAIDSAGRKIYWTDGGRNSIEVAELDGTNGKILIWTGLDSPRAIALHYELGYMFWSDWGAAAKIERADMDGNNRRTIVDTKIKWPNGVAIDRIEGRLYWNDAKILTIESSDFNGHDRRTLLSDVPYPYGIVIVGQHVYWTDWKTKSLHRADKSNGQEKITIRDGLEGLMDIRAIQADRVVENACGTNNGGCSHLCLRSPQGYSCACPTGLSFRNESGNNQKSCKTHPDNSLVIASRGGIVMISFDTPEHMDVTLPVKNINNSIALDYHWEKKLIFFTDVNRDTIRSINMENLKDTKDIITTGIDTPNGLAVDWIADNLYWSDNKFKVIEVSRLDGSSRKTLISDLDEPRGIALFPAKGYLYWSDWHENATIKRSFLDGSQIKTIIDRDIGFPNGISIDYKDRRLYWIDALKERIDTSDLNGQHRVQLVPDAKFPFGMTQYNDYIFWTNWFRKAVLRADKRTGKNVTLIRTHLEPVLEIKAVSSEKQHGWNPCKEDNGGCSHLCLFRGHDYICDCPDAFDDKVCSKTPKLRVDLRMPSHYPSFYDYTDVEINNDLIPLPTAPTESHTATIVIIVTGTIVIIALLGTIIYFILKMRQNHEREAKDNYRESSGHISFHNPNYSCSSSREPLDRRPPRFQGIFKYDKSQGRVTNVYMPEGTSLLPPPPPPPHRVPPRPINDDFEPVTLHSFA